MLQFSAFAQEKNVTTAIECWKFLLKAQFDNTLTHIYTHSHTHRHMTAVRAEQEEGVKRCVHGATVDILFAFGAASNPEGFVWRYENCARVRECALARNVSFTFCGELLWWLF